MLQAGVALFQGIACCLVLTATSVLRLHDPRLVGKQLRLGVLFAGGKGLGQDSVLSAPSVPSLPSLPFTYSPGTASHLMACPRRLPPSASCCGRRRVLRRLRCSKRVTRWSTTRAQTVAAKEGLAARARGRTRSPSLRTGSSRSSRPSLRCVHGQQVASAGETNPPHLQPVAGICVCQCWVEVTAQSPNVNPTITACDWDLCSSVLGLDHDIWSSRPLAA